MKLRLLFSQTTRRRTMALLIFRSLWRRPNMKPSLELKALLLLNPLQQQRLSLA
jgi:hypothetical protein